MVKLGLIGYGYWGPNLFRNFMSTENACVAAVCDRDSERLRKAASAYPAVSISTCPEELIASPELDAIIIATPVHTHYELALAALRVGKHVLVEKPIASSSKQARQLVEEANRRGLTLMVDHTFVYTAAVQKMRELLRSERFGQVRYYDSTRVNLGLFQHDVNVLWDLAVHDLSIMSYVMDAPPVAVSATGHSHIPGQPAYAAFLTVFFDGAMIAHINVNWLSPVKIRRTLVGGDNQMIVYDDLDASEKIKVYDKGITVTEMEQPEHVRRLLISYRTGDLWSPHLPTGEALSTVASHFIRCIEERREPLTGGPVGLQLVRILEAADASMRSNGAPVELDRP